MKTITRITSVLLFSLFVLSACSKDDDGGTSAAGDGELTATVDGASFESFPEATTAVESNAGGVQTLTLSGGTMDSENIQIMIIGFEGVGTYDLNSVSLGSYTYLEDTSNFNSAMVFTTSTGAASNGEIKIAEYTAGGTVTGTFNFTGYLTSNTSQTVAVTNGAFNVTIQ